MKLKRRLASFVVVAALVGIAMAGDPPPVVEPPGALRVLPAGPLLGYGGSDAMAFWAWPPTATAKLELEYSLASGDGAEVHRAAFPALSDSQVTTTLRIAGLLHGATYQYRVLVDGRADETSGGTFRMAPPPGTPVRATFALVSCMHAKRHPVQVAWQPLLATHPDLIVHLGDNIYANSTDPATIRAWYLAQRRISPYAHVLRTTPALSIWDDHDFGANDSDGTLKNKDRSLAIFKELWPNPAAGLPEVPGVFHAASFGDVDLFLLDTRYHRSPNFDADGEKKSIVGAEQFAWLERSVRASKATFKLVGFGSTLDNLKDSWRLFRRDRDRLYGLTKTVPGIVFLSGDIHTSLLTDFDPGEQGGYRIREVISSGIAVNRLTHMFATLAIDTTIPDPTITVRIHTVGLTGDASQTETVIKRSELTPAF